MNLPVECGASYQKNGDCMDCYRGSELIREVGLSEVNLLRIFCDPFR
jgi:hypothetical protein